MRNRYNLAHKAHVVGHIGRLQTLSVIPVVSGDSLELNVDGVMRMGTTRKEIVAECLVDICAFYVPHRHAYGEDWVDLITMGPQAPTTLPAGPAVNADSRDPFYLGIKTCGANVNQALNYGYNAIYQRYFAVPTTATNGTWSFANTAFYPNGVTSDLINHRKYGARAARLPHILNGGTLVNGTNAGGFIRNYTENDWGVQIPQDTPIVGTALLDIRDLKSIQSRYRTIQQQNYFNQFYTDVVAEKWDTQGVNTDADQRPTYLGRVTTYLSGHDVDGTDDATLGSFVGKTLGPIKFKLPRRFFPEHGNVWIMALARYPLVHTKEQHPLLAQAQPDSKLLVADPGVWAGEKIVAYDPGIWMSGGSTWVPNVDQMQQPYGQEYRYQPNRIHPVFEQIPGYPFTQWDGANYWDWYYYQDEEYSDTFQVSQVEHWQIHSQINCIKLSTLVDPKTSIFAGA